MHPAEHGTLVDWIATSLRWLTLLALCVAVATGKYFSTAIVFTFLGAAFWNVLLTMLAVFNARILFFRSIGIAGDLIIALALFYLSGDVEGTLGWVGILPLVSAAVYFGVRGALIVTTVNLLFQGILAYLFNPAISTIVLIGTLAPLYLVLGVLLGVVSNRIGHLLNKGQRQQQAQRREGERAEQGRSKAIYTLISALNASLNYQRVLDTALDLSYTTLAAVNNADERMVASVLLYTHSESGTTELRVGSARRFTSADMRISLPGTAGLLGKTIDESVSTMARKPADDPELGRVVALRSCQSAYCIPLRTGLETYGVLLFAHPDAEFFTAERREVLEIIGSQAVVAIQNARLYRDLELEKERMMEIQEDARKKLARDLHDGPTQSVAALAMRANFARRLMDRDTRAAAEELFKIEDLARRTTKEIRHMLFTLRPLVLESQGLIAALESMAEKMHETFGQNVIIDADPGVISMLEIGKQGVAFYIVEEAVNNARKHAKADHIWVHIKNAGEDLVRLEIEDDGAGFDLGAVDSNYENRGSLGMVNMRERTELVNGVLQIDSAVGKGTRIKVMIPLSEDAADRIRRGK